jgi:transcriptional repressor NrdR
MRLGQYEAAGAVGPTMKCPYCGKLEDRVVDSRSSRDGAAVRRRRECLDCASRFTTYETAEAVPITVTKRDGRTERYDRKKLLRSISVACKKRPVTEEQIQNVGDDVEEQVFSGHRREIESSALGGMVLAGLEDLDKVAYIRFASVYKDFRTTDEFLDEVKNVE